MSFLTGISAATPPNPNLTVLRMVSSVFAAHGTEYMPVPSTYSAPGSASAMASMYAAGAYVMVLPVSNRTGAENELPVRRVDVQFSEDLGTSVSMEVRRTRYLVDSLSAQAG